MTGLMQKAGAGTMDGSYHVDAVYGGGGDVIRGLNVYNDTCAKYDGWGGGGDTVSCVG